MGTRPQKRRTAKPTPTQAGIAERRSHCPLWLSSQCHGGQGCVCVPVVTAKPRTTEQKSEQKPQEASP